MICGQDVLKTHSSRAIMVTWRQWVLLFTTQEGCGKPKYYKTYTGIKVPTNLPWYEFSRCNYSYNKETDYLRPQETGRIS